MVVNRKMWDVSPHSLLSRYQHFNKPDAFIFRVDNKATQKNVVHYPNYFLLFCVLCVFFLCMV